MSPSSSITVSSASGSVSSTTPVHAPIEVCHRVAIDVEAYPQWIEYVQSVEVLDRDDAQRPVRVRFGLRGLGRRTSFVLVYNHRGAPYSVSWAMETGDVMSAVEGSYRFHNMTEDPGLVVTDVDYELRAEPVVPLADFVKRRIEDLIVLSAQRSFQCRAERVWWVEDLAS